MTPQYGRIIIEEGYQHGKVINRTTRHELSIEITTKKQLLDELFEQLDRLKTEHSVSFTVYADKHSHEPSRMVVMTQNTTN